MKRTLIFLFTFFSVFLNAMEEEAHPVSIYNDEQSQERHDAFVVLPLEIEEHILNFLIEEAADTMQNFINILSNKDLANIKRVQKSWNLWIKNKIEKLLKKDKSILKSKWNHPDFPVVFPGESPEALAKETIKTLKSYLLFNLYKYSNKFSMNELGIMKFAMIIGSIIEPSLKSNSEATEELILKYVSHFDQETQVNFYNRKLYLREAENFLILAIKFNCKKTIESILNLFANSLRRENLNNFDKQLKMVNDRNNYKKIIVVLVCVNVDRNITFIEIGNLLVRNYGAGNYEISMHGDINNPTPIYAIIYLYDRKATEGFINHINKLAQSEILWARFGDHSEHALYIAKIFKKITL